MPSLKVVSIPQNGTAFLAALLPLFKTHASIADETIDDLLIKKLRKAALMVQEYADTAFIETKLRLTAIGGRTGRIRLYMGGGDVESVTDLGGEAVAYQAVGSTAVQVGITRPVVITYTTVPLEGEQERLTETVLRCATALYDGVATDELNRILNEAL